jgi:hypothetical protein
MMTATRRPKEADVEGGATEIVATATLFAMLVTKAVDLIRNFATSSGLKPPKWLWNALSLVLAIAAALIWKVNLLDNYGSTGIQGFSGQFFTGLAMAGAASGWHELFDVLSGAAKNAKANALANNTAALNAGAAERNVTGVDAATAS